MARAAPVGRHGADRRHLFAQAAARWFAALGQEPDTDILGRLRILQERSRYTAVYLVDPQGLLRLAPGDSAQGRLPDQELLALHNAPSPRPSRS